MAFDAVSRPESPGSRFGGLSVQGPRPLTSARIALCCSHHALGRPEANDAVPPARRPFPRPPLPSGTSRGTPPNSFFLGKSGCDTQIRTNDVHGTLPIADLFGILLLRAPSRHFSSYFGCVSPAFQVGRRESAKKLGSTYGPFVYPTVPAMIGDFSALPNGLPVETGQGRIGQKGWI